MRDTAAQRRAPLDEPSSAPLEAGSEPEDDEVETPPRLQFTARNVLVLGGFLVASIAALYYLLRSSPVSTTRGTGSRTAARTGCSRSSSRPACSAAT